MITAFLAASKAAVVMISMFPLNAAVTMPEISSSSQITLTTRPSPQGLVRYKL
jgi:hypothetical protein